MTKRNLLLLIVLSFGFAPEGRGERFNGNAGGATIFELIGIDPNTPDEELPAKIREQYRAGMLRFHTDRGAENSSAFLMIGKTKEWLETANFVSFYREFLKTVANQDPKGDGQFHLKLFEQIKSNERGWVNWGSPDTIAKVSNLWTRLRTDGKIPGSDKRRRTYEVMAGLTPEKAAAQDASEAKKERPWGDGPRGPVEESYRTAPTGAPGPSAASAAGAPLPPTDAASSPDPTQDVPHATHAEAQAARSEKNCRNGYKHLALKIGVMSIGAAGIVNVATVDRTGLVAVRPSADPAIVAEPPAPEPYLAGEGPAVRGAIPAPIEPPTAPRSAPAPVVTEAAKQKAAVGANVKKRVGALFKKKK